MCGTPMSISKTARRHIQTIAHGPLNVMEQHRWCPNGCLDPTTGKVFHGRSDFLAILVKHGCRHGYDIECHIGRAMYIENRQAKEVWATLSSYGLRISEREVSSLARRFLDHLEMVHFGSARLLGDALRQAGGYVAHIDATCEKGRGGMFAALSGWNGWALVAGKIDTEHHELITPFLQRAIDTFGAPVAFVRDMGKAMRKSIEAVTANIKQKPPELVCHFHVGKDIGKDILYADHEALLSLFKIAKTKKKLQEFVRMSTETLAQKPARPSVVAWMGNANAEIPDGWEGIAVARSLAQRLLDHGHDESGKKFPFTRPYLELYARCRSIRALIDEELDADRHTGETRKYLERLHSILGAVTCSSSFRSIVEAIQEKADIFDKFRETLRLDSEGGYISKMGEVEPDAMTLAEMEEKLGALIADFQLEHTTMGENAKKAVDIIIAHMEEHGKFLWGHRVTMHKPNGDSIVRFAYRTNNVIECFFRPIKKNIRRRNGCGDTGHHLEHVSSAICYVNNLMNKEYLDIVYNGSLDNLPEKFALYDSQKRIPNTIDTANTPIRGSLPAADKTIIRDKKFLQKVG
jgi:hypothetical protein